MQQQVTFRGLLPVVSVMEEVQKQSAKLGARGRHIETCHVVVEAAGRPGRRTRPQCRVSVRLWGADCSRMLCSSVQEGHVSNLRPAVHRAFEAVRRQLLPRRGRLRGASPQPVLELPIDRGEATSIAG